MKSLPLITASLVAAFLAGPLHAADDLQKIAAEARAAGEKGDSRKAVELWSRLIGVDANHAEAYYWRGRERFRLGEIDASIADFDRFAKLRPERERELWERGIAHYYAGKYDLGAKQFELYQTYHDNDVENSTWRYLCMARSVGVDKARATLLPIKRDARVPMMEIFALYGGKATPADVLKAAEAGNPGRSELSQRLFYAHLYIGLFHEAAGDATRAKEHILIAADKHRIAHYMGDVARIHADRLRAKKEAKPQGPQ